MTTNDNPAPPALLVADDVRRDLEDPQRLIGEFRVGGHRARVVLDFTRQEIGFVEYVEMSRLVAMHEPTQRAVLDLMFRVNDGEAIRFPLDLSEEIRHASPASPFAPMPEEERAALEDEASRVRVDVLAVEHDASEPSRLTAKLRLEGGPTEFEVELYAGPRRVPFMRWLRGPGPENLSAAERYAIQRALLNRLEGAGGG